MHRRGLVPWGTSESQDASTFRLRVRRAAEKSGWDGCDQARASTYRSSVWTLSLEADAVSVESRSGAVALQDGDRRRSGRRACRAADVSPSHDLFRMALAVARESEP